MSPALPLRIHEPQSAGLHHSFQDGAKYLLLPNVSTRFSGLCNLMDMLQKAPDRYTAKDELRALMRMT